MRGILIWTKLCCITRKIMLQREGWMFAKVPSARVHARGVGLAMQAQNALLCYILYAKSP